MAKDRLVTPSYCCILAANFLLYFGFYLLMPVLPFYLTEVFHTGNTMVGIALSCYTVAALTIRPFSGYLLDTLARKPLYLISFFIFTTIFAGYLFAGSLTLFIILRIVHGFAFGTVTVSGNTVVIDIMPSSRRGEGIGYYGLTNNTAMAIGPMVGLFLHDFYSFPVIFLSALTSCSLGWIMASLVRTPPKEPVKRAPVSLDRFILIKGIPAGIDLLLLSIPYGMTTTYVAMYAKEMGIQKGTGIFFTLMAAGMAISRIFSGRQVDKGRITQVIALGMYLACGCFFVLLGLRNTDELESGIDPLYLFRDRPLPGDRFRDDVPGLQHALRQPGTAQPTGYGHLDLPHFVGRRHRGRAAAGRLPRRNHHTGPGLPFRSLPDSRFGNLFPDQSGTAFRKEQTEVNPFEDGSRKMREKSHLQNTTAKTYLPDPTELISTDSFRTIPSRTTPRCTTAFPQRHCSETGYRYVGTGAEKKYRRFPAL